MADFKELKEKLMRNPKNAFLKLEEAEINAAFDYCEGYKDFLNAAKTERLRITARARQRMIFFISFLLF